jgi:threonine/homoserine/homoserine lactone efflux protein
MVTTEFLITSLIVVLIPCTGVIYTISTGLLQGWRASIFAALGCTAGIIPHLFASTVGLAAILHMSAMAFQIIKFLGVAYLLYLAWSMWKESVAVQLKSQNQQVEALGIVIKGFLINILNPKLSLFFLAFLPQFIPVETASAVQSMLLLSGIFMAMTLFVFILYGLFANSVRVYVAGSPRIMRMTQRSFALMFAMLGAKLALTER